MKYPIGIQTFEQIIEEGYSYVDKTTLVYQLAHYAKNQFLSRPRRFGKSLLVSTLQAYFEGRKELFKGLEIEKLEQQWESYPVVHIDLSAGKYYQLDNLHVTLDYILSQYERKYHIEVSADACKVYNVRLANIISTAREQTGMSFLQYVVLPKRNCSQNLMMESTLLLKKTVCLLTMQSLHCVSIMMVIIFLENL